MYLSYSGYKTYLGCPLLYWHRYVAKTALPKPDNKVNSLYGSVVGVLFERFYNDRIWATKGSEATLLDMVDETFATVMKRELAKGGVYDWKAPRLKYRSVEAIAKEVRETVPRGLAIIRQHLLIGKEAAAEIKLDSTISGHCLAGRTDFMIHRVKPLDDLVLLDGKGSKWRDTYVDPRQLHWYAMLYEHHHGVLPDRLGFVFWRFDPDKAVDWVSFTGDDLQALRESALQAVSRIEEGKTKCGPSIAGLPEQERRALLLEVFLVRPSKECKFCGYLSTCDEGQKFDESSRVSDAIGVDTEDVGFG